MDSHGTLATVIAVLVWTALVGFTGAQSGCSFPSEIRGNWTSSRKGLLEFNDTHISGRILCSEAVCPKQAFAAWTCLENSANKYLLQSDRYFDFGFFNSYVCLYLIKVSSTKYVYYHAPYEKHLVFNDFAFVTTEGSTPTLDAVCNLTTPFPTERYHLLVKEDSIADSASFCPQDLLGNYVTSDPSACNATLEVCQGDKKSLQVINSTVDPKLFLSENGSVKCMYSQRDDAKSVTYLTVYNHETLNAGVTGFVCVAIFKSGQEVYLTQQADDCIGLASPNATTPICAFNATLLCPITCQFPSSFTGTWMSTRKGELTIAGDTMSGFEPHGVDCNTTVCTDAPTTFECYMADNNKYLLRSGPTSINSLSVRIYVCLKFNLEAEATEKYVYYHDHSATHDTLEDYVITLNAATPVDAITEVCESVSSIDPALYNVFVKSDKMEENIITCPQELKEIYNVSNSQCEYTMGTCDRETEIKLSTTTCPNLPFYTANGTVSCFHSVVSGTTTFLTLYNKENNLTSGSTYMFTCMAYELFGTSSLRFSQTPYGCHRGQTPTNVTTDDGRTYAFEDIGDCPTSTDEFPWIIIALALAAFVLLIILIIILWICCRKCKCRRRRGVKSDEENIKDNISVQTTSSVSEDVEGGKKKKLVDIFTVGKEKEAIVRKMDRSKLLPGKHARQNEEEQDLDSEKEPSKDEEESAKVEDPSVNDGEEDVDSEEQPDKDEDEKVDSEKEAALDGEDESLDSGVTAEEEVETSSKSEENGDQETVTKTEGGGIVEEDADKDDGYNEFDSEYSDNFESDHSEDKTELSKDSEKKQQVGSKAHNLFLVKAWEKRKTELSTVKSTGPPPKGRSEDKTEGNQVHARGPNKLPGQVVPLAAILAKGSPNKSKDPQSRMSSAGPNLHRFVASPTRKMSSMGDRLEEARMRFAHNIPHLGLYLDYTERRNQLEDEGFWDDLEARKSADDLFNFKELDDLLARMEAGEPVTKEEIIYQASQLGSTSRPSTTRHGTKSTEPGEDGAHTSTRPSTRHSGQMAAGDVDKEGTKTESSKNHSLGDEGNESNVVSFDQPGTPPGIKSPTDLEKVTFAGSANLMARFYSRLNEIRTSKGQNGDSTPSEASVQEKTDKRRIRTALRRLLTERLFPDIRPATPVKPLPVTTDKDDLASGTVTPYTIGTRSKTALSLQSANGDDKRFSTTATKGGILLVESFENSSEKEKDDETALDKHTTLGYYRRHQDQLKKGHISRLYQPAKANTGSTGTAPNTRDVILKDPDFIKSLRDQIGKYNNNGAVQPGTKNSRRPNMSWAYNIPRRGNNGTSDWTRTNSSSDGLTNKEMEDWQLKKLLEELYQDKKYMDSLILTKGDNATEEEITRSLQSGREYLLQRAAYWLDQGPQPPRPPTSTLGLRLEREQSVMSARNPKPNKELGKKKDINSGVVLNSHD